jgi:hypothetical protein
MHSKAYLKIILILMLGTLALFLKHSFYNDDPAKLKLLPNLRSSVELAFNKEDFPAKAVDIFLIMHGNSIIENRLNSHGQIELMRIVELIYRCKKLVTNVKQSSNGLQNKLIQEIVARWDSIFDMLHSIHKNKRLLRKTANIKDKDKFKYQKLNDLINGIDFGRLYQFKTFLRVFKTARLNLSFRYKPTLHRVMIQNVLYLSTQVIIFVKFFKIKFLRKSILIINLQLL